MNHRAKMYESNRKAKDWMKSHGFKDIWMQHHTRFQKDLYHLWDGMAFDSDGDLVFFQIKTNAFPSTKKILKWIKGRNVAALAINVVKKNIRTREYQTGLFRNQTYWKERFYLNGKEEVQTLQPRRSR